MESRSRCLALAAIAAALLFAPAPSHSQNGSPAPAPGLEARLSPDQMRTDFDVLIRSLEEAHGGFERFAPRAKVEERLASHRKRLRHEMTGGEFAGVIAETIAELRDGHARLELDSVSSAALVTAHVFPLRVHLENDRLMVLFNDAVGDSTIPPGTEILRINGRKTKDLLRTLLPKVSGDGFIETGKRARLSKEFPQLYWLHVQQTDTYTITVRDARGRGTTSTLPGVIERERLLRPNPINRPVSETLARVDGEPGNIGLSFFENDRTAILRIRLFDGVTFPTTLDSAFAAIIARSPHALILDLRGNGGGVDDFGAVLVSHFVARPFRYFESIHLTTNAPSFATWLPRTFQTMRAGTVPDPRGGYQVTQALHPGVGEQSPAPKPYLGKLIVLIDGGTFSTAADVAAQLKSQGRATFVGEETGGGYEGNTSGLNAMIVLPNSRLRTKIMMLDYWNAVLPPKTTGRGVLPDVVVPRRVSDLVKGTDAALEQALFLAR